MRMIATTDGIGGPFGLIFGIVIAFVIIAAWVILAASRFVQGGVVERPERVPQLYGYTACLIGLIWALTSAVTLVERALERGEPALASTNDYTTYSEPAITSFEAFRATYDRARRFGSPSDEKSPPADSIPEVELKRRYEALRADRIAQAQFRTQKAIISSLVNLLLAGGLFLFHWRWLRRRGIDLDAARGAAARPPLVS